MMNKGEPSCYLTNRMPKPVIADLQFLMGTITFVREADSNQSTSLTRVYQQGVDN